MKTACRYGNYARRAAFHVALSMMVAVKTLSEEGTQETNAASAAFRDYSHDQKHEAVKNGYEPPIRKSVEKRSRTFGKASQSGKET